VGPQLVSADGAWDPRDHGELRGFRARVAQAAGSSHYRRRTEPADAAWVSGAACLVLRSAFDCVGGFDPGFFLYKEEEDLFLRIRRAGGRVRYLPSVRVRHDEAAVASRDAHMPASAARFADKHIRSGLQRRVMPRVHHAVAVWGGRFDRLLGH
jgi:GT2 family glycosyltransferase